METVHRRPAIILSTFGYPGRSPRRLADRRHRRFAASSYDEPGRGAQDGATEARCRSGAQIARLSRTLAHRSERGLQGKPCHKRGSPMSTKQRYAIPVDATEWAVPGSFDTVFKWEYQEGSDALRKLYEKGKNLQWNTTTRIDWSQDLDPENPQELPDESISIFGSDLWNRLNRQERANLRRHMQAWSVSQFLHGEQGALICTAKIVQQVPNVDAKFYAATQVMDEARHVETYSRLLHEKFDLAYPITPPLKRLLNDVLSDSRWDMTYLGMQVLIEGLALAAFAGIRDTAKNSLAAAVNAYVMQDEARHVAFGRLALRDYYPQLSQPERDEREEFAVEASYLMRDRFRSEEVWETFGLPVEQCVEYVDWSPDMREFQSRLFSRIVPTIKNIGPWGPKIRRAYSNMGVMALAELDSEQLMENDEKVA